MDPLSITTACVALTTTIAKTSLTVTTFVRSVRAARSDLDGISRELASLTTLLELIAEDTADINALPETLRKQIARILSNCQVLLLEIQRLVEKYSGSGVINGSKWTLAGSEDVTKLRLSLEAHKSALEIALEMVTLFVTKEIKADTGVIRDNTAAIRQDTTLILAEIARLKAQLPDSDATLIPNVQETDARLASYLDGLTSYAETVCWSGEDSDTEAATSVGDATPSESPISQSSPGTYLPDTMPAFRDLIHDPFLTSKVKTSSTRPQRGSTTLVPASPKPSGASHAPTASDRKRSPSKHHITQRVIEKLQAQVEADSVHSRQEKRQLNGDDVIRKTHRKSDRAASLGAKREPETQIEYRNTGKDNAPRSCVADVPRINNPRLLATVEDAIKRLVLPELSQMKADKVHRRRERSGTDQKLECLVPDTNMNPHQCKRQETLAGLPGAVPTVAAPKQLGEHESYERQETREKRRKRQRERKNQQPAAPVQTDEPSAGARLTTFHDDVEAMISHLAVRDAQRNARDTEVLVNLVRSAHEMRNQLDDLKQFIETQDNINLNTQANPSDIRTPTIIEGRQQRAENDLFNKWTI